MRPTKEQIIHDLDELSDFIKGLDDDDDTDITKCMLAGQVAVLVLMIRKHFNLTSFYYVTGEIEAEQIYREVYGNDTSMDKRM